MPPRGTRPANRRELLRVAAADLFARTGYANVSMADVAGAVNISPSSVYKHYSGKSELLFETLDFALNAVMAELPDPETAELGEIARALASATIDNRAVGVLLQREVRHLSLEPAALVRKKRGQIARCLAVALTSHRTELKTDQADLLALCAIDALSSVSFHGVKLPRPRFDDILTELALRILRLEVQPGGARREPGQRRPQTVSRSDQILDAATALFAARGYADVGIEDIGAAVGMAGPSLYNHFPNKQAILGAAMTRGHEKLRTLMRDAQQGAANPSSALRQLTDGYVDTVLDDPDLIAVVITESIHLQSQATNQDARRLQREFIADWVGLAQTHRPGENTHVTRIKVQAAQMMANDLARTPRARRVAGLRATVRDAAWAAQQ